MTDTLFRLGLRKLRHLYEQMIGGLVTNYRSAADGLLGPAIELLERHEHEYLASRDDLATRMAAAEKERDEHSYPGPIVDSTYRRWLALENEVVESAKAFRIALKDEDNDCVVEHEALFSAVDTLLAAETAVEHEEMP